MTSRFIVLSCARGLLLLAAGLLGCKDQGDSGSGGAKAPKLSSASSQAAVARAPGVVAALEDVMANCEVTARGELHPSRCRTSGVLQGLRRVEAAAGERSSVSAYCNALLTADRPMRFPLAARIGKFANDAQMRRCADKGTFECLLKALARSEDARSERHLARAVALMGPLLGRIDDVMVAIAEVSPVAQQAAYQALWATGRVEALPALKKVLLGHSDIALRLAVLRGFGDGPRMNVEEAKQVCALLAPLLTHKDEPLAATAALRVAVECPESKDALIRAASQWLSRGTVGPVYVRALSTTAEHYAHRATRAQRVRIVAILVKVLRDPKASDETRSAALRVIYRLDRVRAKEVARSLLKSDQPVLRKTAARVVGKI